MGNEQDSWLSFIGVQMGNAMDTLEQEGREVEKTVDVLAPGAIDAAKAEIGEGLEAAAPTVDAVKDYVVKHTGLGGLAGQLASEGHHVDPRPLTQPELSDAQAIFGTSIDYTKVRVDGGDLASLEASARTIGNTVHMSPGYFAQGSTDLTDEGRRVLVHELTHVWQYQHQGWTYAPEALWAQLKAKLSEGDSGKAYDWEAAAKSGTPWDKLNPEQQAEVVEDYNRALHRVHDGKPLPNDYATLELAAPYLTNLTSGP